MEIEKLREVTELLQSMGLEAKEAFICWLLVTEGASFILHFTFWGLLFFLAMKGFRLLREFMASERLRKAAGVSYDWSERELAQACDVLRKHYKNG